MNKVRLFLSSIILAALALSTSLQAGISPLSFNGIFKCFKKPEFAPNLGCAALQTGTVNNIRFCMVNPGKKDKEGNRSWIKDRAPHPVAALATLLFPSPAGSLAVMTSHKNNIGRYLTVEHIAQLLNFCAQVRAAVPHMSGNQFGKNAHKCIERLIAAANKKLEPHTKNYFTKFFESEAYSADTASMNTLRSLLKHTQQGRELLVALCKIIELEERAKSNSQFYPKFQAEQLLNAFFCLKFGKDDIPTLLAHLDDSIVNKDVLVEQRILDKTDFEKSNQKDLSMLTLDDLWILQNRNIIDQVIPFEAKSHPIDYALASGYNRTQKQQLKLEFTDCMETVFRLFCSLMFYSKELSSFDLSLLKNHLKDSPILKNFEEFFQLQTPSQINSGSRVVRDACNRIVGDLGHPVRYNQKSSFDKEYNDNEISGGIINFIRVLATAFNIECSPEPIYRDYQQFITETTNWVVIFLQKIYSLFNPQKTVSIDITNVSCPQTSINSECDCSGKIKIKVDNDFEFTMDISCGHAQFDSINILAPVERSISPDLLHAIVEKINYFFSKTVGKSLLLLDSNTASAITQPIYSLFRHDLRNSAQIIQVLEKLYSLTNSSQVSVEHAALLLQNCLQNFEWKNYRMMNRIQFTLKKWLKLIKESKNETLSKVLQAEVQAIQYNVFEDSFDNVDNLLNYFHGTSMLFLDGNRETIFSPAQNHPSIKKIDFTDAYIEEVTITHDSFPNLEEFDLSNTENLQGFKLLGSFSELRKVSFESSSIPKIKISSDNCPNLEVLDVNNTEELEKFLLLGTFRKLNSIDLSGSAVSQLKISGENFPSLQKIDLSSTKNLKQLELTGSFANIKKISLYSSGITQLKLASEYPNLEILDLKNTEQLESLELSGIFKKLSQILLSSSAIATLKLDGKNFPALRNIELEWTNNLQRFELSGDFEQLSEIDLAYSTLAQLKVFGCCPNLKIEDSRIIFDY